MLLTYFVLRSWVVGNDSSFSWRYGACLAGLSRPLWAPTPCQNSENHHARQQGTPKRPTSEKTAAGSQYLFCKEISHSPLGACIAIVCCAPPTPSLLRLQLLSCAYSSAETWSLCVQRCVCLYALYKRLYYLPVPHALVPFLFSLSGWVHTRCRQVQSLCSPSTDTQSCLIKLLDQ